MSYGLFLAAYLPQCILTQIGLPHFQHLEKASVSNLHIVTVPKTRDDEMAKPHLNVTDKQLFVQTSAH